MAKKNEQLVLILLKTGLNNIFILKLMIVVNSIEQYCYTRFSLNNVVQYC